MPAAAVAPPVSQEPGALPVAGPWQPWNVAYSDCTLYTGTSNSTAIGTVTWGSWNAVYTSTSGSTLVYDAGGNVAVTSRASLTTPAPQWTTWNTVYEEAEEARLEREERTREILERQRERQAEMEARAAGQRAEREQAEARSLELLRSLLTAAQWASYTERGWFEVKGKSGRHWRIRNRGQSGNVDLMPEIGEERDASYCAHPPGSLPAADAHAAQMLALVTDDEAFMRVANVHWRRPGLRELQGVA